MTDKEIMEILKDASIEYRNSKGRPCIIIHEFWWRKHARIQVEELKSIDSGIKHRNLPTA